MSNPKEVLDNLADTVSSANLALKKGMGANLVSKHYNHQVQLTNYQVGDLNHPMFGSNAPFSNHEPPPVPVRRVDNQVCSHSFSKYEEPQQKRSYATGINYDQTAKERYQR